MFNIETNTYRSENTKTKSVPTESYHIERESEKYIIDDDESKHKWEMMHDDNICHAEHWIHSPSLWFVMPECEVCDAEDGNLETQVLEFDNDSTIIDNISTLENTYYENSGARRNAECANSEYEVRTPAHLPPLYPVYTNSEQSQSKFNDITELPLHTPHCFRFDDSNNSEESLLYCDDANVQSYSSTHAYKEIDEEQQCMKDEGYKITNKENLDDISIGNALTTTKTANNELEKEEQEQELCNMKKKSNDEAEIVNMRREIAQLHTKLEEQAREHEMEIKEQISKVTRSMRLDERKTREEFQRVLEMLRDENAQLQSALEQRRKKCSHSSALITLIESNSTNKPNDSVMEDVNNNFILSANSNRTEPTSNNNDDGDNGGNHHTNCNCLECAIVEAQERRQLHDVEKCWQERLANAHERLSGEMKLYARQRNELERDIRYLNHALQQLRDQLEQQLLENTLLKSAKQEFTRHHVHSDEVQRWRAKVKELERRLALLTTQPDARLHTNESTKQINTSDNLCINGDSNNSEDNVDNVRNQNDTLVKKENAKLQELLLQKEKELDNERRRCAHLITLYGAQLATLHAELKRVTHRELDAHKTS